MNPVVIGAIAAIALMIGIMCLLDLGRRIGTSRLAREGESAAKGFGAIEGAIFGLLGLILAFSFSGALARFDARRHLVVEETNRIGTAWLRLSLLPPENRAPLQALVRTYLDSRITLYQNIPNRDATTAELARSDALQSQIWEAAIAASRDPASTPAPMLLLPALNAMFDIRTTRTEAARLHPPGIIFVMLGTLTLACALFAGYDMAGRRRLSPLHSAGFALVLAVTVYVIVDLEFPRLGLIQVTDSDHALVDLRRSMNP